MTTNRSIIHPVAYDDNLINSLRSTLLSNTQIINTQDPSPSSLSRSKFSMPLSDEESRPSPATVIIPCSDADLGPSLHNANVAFHLSDNNKRNPAATPPDTALEALNAQALPSICTANYPAEKENYSAAEENLTRSSISEGKRARLRDTMVQTLVESYEERIAAERAKAANQRAISISSSKTITVPETPLFKDMEPDTEGERSCTTSDTANRPRGSTDTRLKHHCIIHGHHFVRLFQKTVRRQKPLKTENKITNRTYNCDRCRRKVEEGDLWVCKYEYCALLACKLCCQVWEEG
jgi:hypothetical protein